MYNVSEGHHTFMWHVKWKRTAQLSCWKCNFTKHYQMLTAYHMNIYKSHMNVCMFVCLCVVCLHYKCVVNVGKLNFFFTMLFQCRQTSHKTKTRNEIIILEATDVDLSRRNLYTRWCGQSFVIDLALVNAQTMLWHRNKQSHIHSFTHIW